MWGEAVLTAESTGVCAPGYEMGMPTSQYAPVAPTLHSRHLGADATTHTTHTHTQQQTERLRPSRSGVRHQGLHGTRPAGVHCAAGPAASTFGLRCQPAPCKNSIFNDIYLQPRAPRVRLTRTRHGQSPCTHHQSPPRRSAATRHQDPRRGRRGGRGRQDRSPLCTPDTARDGTRQCAATTKARVCTQPSPPR